MTSQPHFDADVVIIGYGPSGVSAANALGSRGVKTIALERFADIHRRARAVTVNDWTMRLFQSVGLDDVVKRDMDETVGLRWMTYEGQELSRIGFPPGDLGHPRSFSIYQPLMEQSLRDGAARFADHLDVSFGQEFTDIEQDEGGVTVTATDSASGERTIIRARYALACDGGSSATRERLGIKLLGETVETKWVIIDARVKRWWPNRHYNTFWSDARRPVVDIALSKGTHRWELPLEAHETEADFATHAQLWSLLETMGITPDNVEIDQHAFYKHHVRSAERWRDGRVFLVGDAAHLMPPWAGQGMQSGIRDAFNLCWKLNEVLAGRLPGSVLDSYEPERRPDVEKFTEISVGLGRLIKQQLSEAELAAMRAPPSGEPEPAPLLDPPTIAAGWLTGDTGPDSAVGKFIPQPRVGRANGQTAWLDTVIGNGFVLLGGNIDPRTVMSGDECTAWDALGAGYHAVRSVDQHGLSDSDIIDLDGMLLDWMQRYGARIIAVRPDRFVAAADTGGLTVPRPFQVTRRDIDVPADRSRTRNHTATKDRRID